MKKHTTVLLLTACVNPNGMYYTKLQNPEERLSQYINALDFYIVKTNWPIVFCENSNVDISARYQDEIQSGRLECLTFNGNSYDRSRGKGFGEALIIKFALEHSQLLQECRFVVKVTGRLIISNILKIVRWNFILPFNCNVCDYSHAADCFLYSMLFISNTKMLQELVNKVVDEVNDTEGIYFEHVLYKTATNKEYIPLPLLCSPLIIGVSGTSNRPYPKADESFYTTDALYLYKKAMRMSGHVGLSRVGNFLYLGMIGYGKIKKCRF